MSFWTDTTVMFPSLVNPTHVIPMPMPIPIMSEPEDFQPESNLGSPLSPSDRHTRVLATRAETTNCNDNPGAGDGNTIEEWALLSDAMSIYDAQLIQDWKDDLGNLLIFAGLFSSVVAGFTIESYGWLQQDNSDVQVQLLAQISAQLASFSAAQGFVNSTVGAASLASLTDSFEPSVLDVRINILWFLSLAISLIASLLAIMVQQWFRIYRVPGHVSTRERIRLRQYRFDALYTWCVPGIVSTLPLLLQIALILFLVGLCDLLASLDKTVAKVFIAFVGVSLTAYSCFTVLPIAFRRCPYKNSIAHTVVVIFKLASFFTLIVLFFSFYILVLGVQYLSLPFRKSSREASLLRAISFHRRMLDYCSTIARILSANLAFSGNAYWDAQDLDSLTRDKYLDLRSLSWAPSALSHSDRIRINQCLDELPPDARIVCLQNWISQALNVTNGLLLGNGQLFAFTRATLAKIDGAFSDRFRWPLLDTVPHSFTRTQDGGRGHEATVLQLLRHVARTRPQDPEWINAYAGRLFSSCSPSEFGEMPVYRMFQWIRLPTACLYELSTIVRRDFAADEVLSLLSQANYFYDKAKTKVELTRIVDAFAEVLITSAATALHAVARQPSLLEQPQIQDRCGRLLTDLSETVVVLGDRIQGIADQPPDHSHDGVLSTFAPACNMLCTSIVHLADAGKMPVDHAALSVLVSRLARFCTGRTLERGRTALESFGAALASSAGLEPEDDASNMGGPAFRSSAHRGEEGLDSFVAVDETIPVLDFAAGDVDLKDGDIGGEDLPPDIRCSRKSPKL